MYAKTDIATSQLPTHEVDKFMINSKSRLVLGCDGRLGESLRLKLGVVKLSLCQNLDWWPFFGFRGMKMLRESFLPEIGYVPWPVSQAVSSFIQRHDL